MPTTTCCRFTAAGTALVDRETGLAWAPAPAGPPVPWTVASAAAAGEGLRLPTAAELMTLLAGLPDDFPGTPAPGDVVWSASGSPFAPPSRVRAIACDGPGRFVVVLLARTDSACWWGVHGRRHA